MERGTILVAGGTGLIGSQAAVALNRADYRVRIMSRNPERARRMFPDEYEITEGDATQTDTLTDALEGCTGLYISISASSGTEGENAETLAVRNLLDAARQQRVTQVIYVSGSTVSEETTWFPPMKAKWEAEHTVRESGIPYTIFRPTWFIDSLPRFVRNNRAMVFGKNKNTWNWVAAEDFAQMVVSAFEKPEAQGKTLYVHGPEAHTFQKALEVYCYVAHPSASVKVISFWTLRLLAFLYRRPQLKAVIPLMDYFQKSPQQGDPTEANRILGTPTITISEWASKHKRDD